MTESPSTGINYFIRDVAQRNQPIFELYKHLCKLHPNRVIDYVDFEWKYYRYYHGCSDLNMERSPDSQSPVTIGDLPVEILEKIVGQSALLDCLTLRKVNHDLRNLVDSSEVNCESIDFCFDDTFWIMKLDDLTLRYKENRGGSCMVTSYRRDTRREKKYKVRRNFQEAMIVDASTFLSNPKLKIGNIGFETWPAEGTNKLVDYVKSLTSPLDARSIQLSGEAISSVLHSFKPERLEEIVFLCAKFTLNELEGMTEEWKRKARLIACEHPGAGIENMVHFKEIESSEFVLNFNEANLIKIRDVLLKSPHLQMCCLTEYCDRDESDVNWIRSIDRIMGQDHAFDVRTRRFSIPDSRDYFQLELEKEWYYTCLKITKHSP